MMLPAVVAYLRASPSMCVHSPGMLRGSRGPSGMRILFVTACFLWVFPAMQRYLQCNLPYQER